MEATAHSAMAFRLLRLVDGEIRLHTSVSEIPKYAIVSHTWSHDGSEITFADIASGLVPVRPASLSYKKLKFCAEQAKRDGIEWFWIDSCCLDPSNSSELHEAVNSMFEWYRIADKCYVYLSDVSVLPQYIVHRQVWQPMLSKSRWFTRGWTLQELLAPKAVLFYTKEGTLLGTREDLQSLISSITGIPWEALHTKSLSDFTINERWGWAKHRATTRGEDIAYCLLGIFGVHMPLRYGEGKDAALKRLKQAVGTVGDAFESNSLSRQSKPMATRGMPTPSGGHAGNDKLSVSNLTSCVRCRNRKTYCYKERPVCSSCKAANYDCVYPTEERRIAPQSRSGLRGDSSSMHKAAKISSDVSALQLEHEEPLEDGTEKHERDTIKSLAEEIEKYKRSDQESRSTIETLKQALVSREPSESFMKNSLRQAKEKHQLEIQKLFKEMEALRNESRQLQERLKWQLAEFQDREAKILAENAHAVAELHDQLKKQQDTYQVHEYDLRSRYENALTELHKRFNQQCDDIDQNKRAVAELHDQLEKQQGTFQVREHDLRSKHEKALTELHKRFGQERDDMEYQFQAQLEDQQRQIEDQSQMRERNLQSKNEKALAELHDHFNQQRDDLQCHFEAQMEKQQRESMDQFQLGLKKQKDAIENNFQRQLAEKDARCREFELLLKDQETELHMQKTKAASTSKSRDRPGTTEAGKEPTRAAVTRTPRQENDSHQDAASGQLVHAQSLQVPPKFSSITRGSEASTARADEESSTTIRADMSPLPDIWVALERLLLRESLGSTSIALWREAIDVLAQHDPEVILDHELPAQSLFARGQVFVEKQTGTPWHWWPLPDPIYVYEDPCVELEYMCQCGSRGRMPVPEQFIRHLNALRSHTNKGANSGDSSSSASASSKTVSSNNMSDASSSRTSSSITSSTGKSAQSSEQDPDPATPKTAADQIAQTGQMDLLRKLYVFLVVTRGDSRKLCQLEVQSKNDDDFFLELRREYLKARAFIRRWLSVWKYHHCDFYLFKKIEPHEIVAVVRSMPELGKPGYVFEPNALNPSCPISPDEFKRRFDLCYRSKHGRHRHWPWFRPCRKPSRPKRDNLDLIPKRRTNVIEDSDASDLFWGLLAVEHLNFWVVAIYQVLFVCGPIVFGSLWISVMGHHGDLQNSSIPTVMTLALMSAFWWPYLNSKKDERS